MPRLNDLGQGKIESPKIRPELIIIRDGYNFRDTSTPDVRAHIDWLKESIKAEGIREPVDVEYTAGEVFLVAGECRTRAAQELRKEGWDGYIPVTSVKGDEATVLALSIIDNGGLLPTILEFGEGFRRLGAYGWPVEKIATYVPASIAKTRTLRLKFVQDAVELAESPLEVKELVSKGSEGVSVSPALAVAATKKNRIMAAEIIKGEIQKAKSAGKKVATRSKGIGVVTKAKNEKDEATVKLLELGDNIAAAILEGTPNWDRLERMARKYQKGRV